jgi:hypothetical protein|tara:strand:- start:257 stop:517 length:261 start_codon:yes stop_codon:yes gene_type:complete
MIDVRISGIAPNDPPIKRGKSLVVAVFDADIGAVRLERCLLVETFGNRRVWGPSPAVRFSAPLARFLTREASQALADQEETNDDAG